MLLFSADRRPCKGDLPIGLYTFGSRHVFGRRTGLCVVCKGIHHALSDTADAVILQICRPPTCHCGSIPLIRPYAMLMDFDNRGSLHTKLQAPMGKTARAMVLIRKSSLPSARTTFKNSLHEDQIRPVMLRCHGRDTMLHPQCLATIHRPCKHRNIQGWYPEVRVTTSED